MRFKMKVWGSDDNGYWESNYKSLTRDDVDKLEEDIKNHDGYEGHEVEPIENDKEIGSDE